MTYLHIVAIWIFFVILITVAIIISICNKRTILSKDMDFFTSYVTKKRNKLENSGIGLSANAYFLIMLIMPVIMGVGVGVISKKAVFALIVALASLSLPEGIVRLLQKQIDKEFEERYAKSLEQLGAALKSGMTILQAVQEVANNKFIHESIRKKYQNINLDIQMGVSIADAFRHFAENTNNQDAWDVAIAIDVQSEVGGREADVIMNISEQIHERMIFRKEIKSMFSGTSSMVTIMDFIPLGIILYLCFMDSSYLNYYFSNIKNVILLLCLIGCCLIGSFINHHKLQKIMKGV